MVIERCVALQLTAYLQENQLFPDHQSAYRQGHSTGTALLKFSSDILDAADSGQVTLLGLLDLSAAFDIVDHDIFLSSFQVSMNLHGLDRLIHPTPKSICSVNFKVITDTAAIRCVAGTTLVHPLHLGCDFNCYFTRCWSSLVHRRQSTLSICPFTN